MIYLARKRTGLTLEQIGKALGGLEYKTAGKAVQRFQASLVTKPERRKLASSLLEQLSLVDSAEIVGRDSAPPTCDLPSGCLHRRAIRRGFSP